MLTSTKHLLRRTARNAVRKITGHGLSGFAPLSPLSTSSHSTSSRTDSFHWALLPGSVIFSTLVLFSLNTAYAEKDPRNGVDYVTEQTFTNWSDTHSCTPFKVYEPKSPQEVLRLLQSFHETKTKVRAVGTCLSPNGIGMSNQNLISSTSLDSIIVDAENQLVTVGGGALVSNVLKELKKYDLTLQNFSSIQEQQMAGWTQVAAHGTGCTLPTVDDMIVRMKIATPTEGLLTLSNNSNPDLFSYAKVGLGALGVVTELTLKCAPRHSLLEHTYTTSINDIKKGHSDRLKNYRHVRYMWLPYTSKVVVVASNPVDEKTLKPLKDNSDPIQTIINTWKEKEENLKSSLKPTYAFAELLQSLDSSITKESINNFTFTQFRDRLLTLGNPLDVEFIKKLNYAESEYWKLSTGSRVDDSTNILGFDCGGEQYVFEVCFPIGSLSDANQKSFKDIEFIEKLLTIIEKNAIPTPCPIEQRWTSRSTSKMSPAYSTKEDEVFSWVGIIMYIPKTSDASNNSTSQEEVEKAFHKYMNAIRGLCEEYNAIPHWAKIELPRHIPLTEKEEKLFAQSLSGGYFDWLYSFFGYSSKVDTPKLDSDEALLEDLQKRLKERYPLSEFNEYRYSLDGNGILGNPLLDTLLKTDYASKKPHPSVTWRR